MKLATVLAAVLFAAVLFAGSASTALAQGTGGRDGGTFVAPTGGPPSEKPPSGTPPARTLADIKEETEAGIVYQPCPANVRFPNGQLCLGLPGSPFYRPYHTPKQR
jgi:hypothetical protein